MAEADANDHGLDLDRVKEVFEVSKDFTIGLEEEFLLLDPESLELVHRFEEIYALCQSDGVLADSAAGELIDTEIEIRSGRGETFGEAVQQQQASRDRLFSLAESSGVALGSVGAHPWADDRDQQIIDTPHYRRLQHDLGWVAQRNNTWSMHVHVGINGADRAVAVSDRLREYLPILLAVSANSPFLDGRDSGLHSVRTEIFTRSFPRCGVHQPFVDWDTYAGFVELLHRTGTIVEATQLWWSVRPHHHFGTVEVRICDAQTDGAESTALAGLAAACVGQPALDSDEVGGRNHDLRLDREIEENFWRAIRYGMDGEMIDFEAGEVVPTRELLERTVEWASPAAEAMGITVDLPAMNGAQRAREAFEQGESLEEILRLSVDLTARSYSPERS
ncbi:MAG: YbdK family carboxylate-amine ligase [bacterium]